MNFLMFDVVEIFSFYLYLCIIEYSFICVGK